jgi:hypothetical protein
MFDVGEVENHIKRTEDFLKSSTNNPISRKQGNVTNIKDAKEPSRVRFSRSVSGGMESSYLSLVVSVHPMATTI